MKEIENRMKRVTAEMEKIENDPVFRVEHLKFVIAEQMCEYMEAHEISRTELAEKLDTSTAYITKILRGNCTFTLESLDKMAAALDCHLFVGFLPLR